MALEPRDHRLMLAVGSVIMIGVPIITGIQQIASPILSQTQRITALEYEVRFMRQELKEIKDALRHDSPMKPQAQR